MRGNKRLVVIGSLLLTAAWAIWCMYFLPRGMGIEHEGWYASEAWRLAQGDLLFRDAVQSSVTLSFWWLSWVFCIYPECSLLGLRIIWAITMLLCALVTANLMLRYFNPLVSFTAAAASLFFIDGVTTITALSWNNMPTLPLLLAAWLWLTAHHRSGKMQLLLAAGAGAAAFLATTCKITVVIVIFLPILTMLYDHWCGVKADGLWRATIAFLATYLAGVLSFFVAVGSMGLMGDLFSGWALAASHGAHRLDQLAHFMIGSSLFILLPGLVVVLIVAFFRYRKDLIAFSIKRKEAIKDNIPLIITASVLFIAFLAWFYLAKLGGLQYVALLGRCLIAAPVLETVAWLPFLVATGVILADVIFHLFSHVFNLKTGENVTRIHDRCRLGIIAIFLCLVVILGTTEFPARTAWLGAWLLISLAIGLSWVWVTDWSKYITRLRFVWLLRGVCIVLLLLFPYHAILRDCQPWHDSPVTELTATLKTARLHGILTTPQRANFIDSVVDAVESNSEVGDRILVYYHMPMLYYLTNRLPSINITWLMHTIGNSTRQSALEDMIQRDRIPKVVVHYLKQYRVPNDPIYEYIEEHYEAVQKVGMVEIMLPKAEEITGSDYKKQ